LEQALRLQPATAKLVVEAVSSEQAKKSEMTAEARGVAALNALPAEDFIARLRACCAASGFAPGLEARRPFAFLTDLLAAADAAWAAAPEDDRLAAFAAHPPIGLQKLATLPHDQRFAAWSASEQAGVGESAAAVLDDLEAENTRYVEKFGFVFLVCATGKTASEMLGMLKDRVLHTREEEIAIAGEQQRLITAIRIRKLVETEGEDQNARGGL
jgi:OHCU decarboxylase